MSDSDKSSRDGPIASRELLLGIERIERLEEEKKGIADDIKDVYAEYKSRGFDIKTMREIVKLRKLTPEQRREREAMLDTYKAALGMLDGTPLGKWAVERLKKEDDPKPQDGPDPKAPADNGVAESDDAQGPGEAAAPPLTVEDARAMGTQAAAAGHPVTSNPFPAFDDRRAAWDEAWCAALGSDGMDIPDALKPAAKTKKADQGHDAKAAGEVDRHDAAGEDEGTEDEGQGE